MIGKVYEANPLICPQCGGRMPACALHLSTVPTAQVDADRTIISFIEDHKVIDKIINYLKLTFKAERPSPPESQTQLLMAAEDFAEYF